MRAQKVRVGIATLLGLMGAAITQPSTAQTEKEYGSGGTGGAAGYSPPMPDTSRGTGAPNPDFEAEPPQPMNAPPAAETTEESKPASEGVPKEK